jgi:hypothetical protein
MAAQFITCKKTNDIDPTMDAGFLPIDSTFVFAFLWHSNHLCALL